MDIKLIYVGNGDWLGGVPQCDLTQDQIEAAGQHGYTRDSLIASGLYLPPDRVSQPGEGAIATPAPKPQSMAAAPAARSKKHVE